MPQNIFTPDFGGRDLIRPAHTRADRSSERTAPSRDEVAEWLRDLAATSNDDRFAKAARVLCPQPAGRHAIDDVMAIEEMRILVGEGQSVEEAARAAARTRSHHSLVAATKRLARKYRSQEQNSTN